jgi:hypothetical protein
MKEKSALEVPLEDEVESIMSSAKKPVEKPAMDLKRHQVPKEY